MNLKMFLENSSAMEYLTDVCLFPKEKILDKDHECEIVEFLDEAFRDLFLNDDLYSSFDQHHVHEDSRYSFIRRLEKEYSEKLNVKRVYDEGGGEGGAEDVTSVILFGDKYYRLDYKYYSYDGYSGDIDEAFTCMFEVQPKVKQVTFYE